VCRRYYVCGNQHSQGPWTPKVRMPLGKNSGTV
jgi:hypothetical protein